MDRDFGKVKKYGFDTDGKPVEHSDGRYVELLDYEVACGEIDRLRQENGALRKRLKRERDEYRDKLNFMYQEVYG